MIVDDVLYRLRVHRLPYCWDEGDVSLWHAVCPSCCTGSWSLRIRALGDEILTESFGAWPGNAPASLKCRSCPASKILDILRAEPMCLKVEAVEYVVAKAVGLMNEVKELGGSSWRIT